MTVGQARQVLGLAPGADAAGLARAYRAAVKIVHPDLGGDAERLREVIEAHRLLKSLAETRLAFTPAPRPQPAPQTSPRSLSLRISVHESLFGGQRRLVLQGGRRLDVQLPQGLRPGDALRLARIGGEDADVMIRISLLPQPGISVRGGDLWIEVSFGAAQLRPGTRLEIDTPRGRRALSAPQGAAGGGLVRLRGEGLPARGRHPAGDLILKLNVDPAAEEPVSKKLLRRFSSRWAA